MPVDDRYNYWSVMNPHSGYVPSNKDLDPNLSTKETVEMLQECSREEILSADNLVTGYMDKDKDQIRSRSIVYKPFYDFKREFAGLKNALKDRWDRQKRQLWKEVNLSAGDWLGLARARYVQYSNAWTFESTNLDYLVDSHSGSVCRSFDILRGFFWLGLVSRIYFCHTHNLNKYKHTFWRIGNITILPGLGLYDIFFTPCQEDMRVNYNYYLYKPPKLQELQPTFQKLENVAAKYSQFGSKVIIPEEFRGEGRGRYATIPKELEGERNWEAERQHGKLWDELREEQMKESREFKYTDKETTAWVADFACMLHTDQPYKSENVPWKQKEKERLKPDEAKALYDERKRKENEEEKPSED